MTTENPLRLSFGECLQVFAMAVCEWPLWFLSRHFDTFIWALCLFPPRYLAWSSRIHARIAEGRAVRRVPAYAELIARNLKLRRTDRAAGDAHGRNGIDSPPCVAPETDKETYIKAFPIEQRCVGGMIPTRETMIDESSGSTGTPYNWVRSPEERIFSHRFISFFVQYCFGQEPGITINAFSMGAWATGLNMGASVARIGIVKNTGPDISKILYTLRFFGPGYRYLITGYPPFLKHLIDVAEVEGFPFANYRLNALVGGEGMSEGLRDYLLRRFENVYSGYGATDLEIGIAGETPTSVAIRRLARDNAEARRRLFGDDSRLPMVFQYNPLMHRIEVNARGELLFTITRSNLLSPRIRYNVHDQGGVARYDEMAEVLVSLGCDIQRLAPDPRVKALRLPFLWVYGRSDYTVSVMGANIYPEDLEQALYADPGLASLTRSFCLSVSETSAGTPCPCFLFEIDGEPTAALRERYAASVPAHLREVNADFREACKEFPEAMVPEVLLYSTGTGPFAEDKGKIKQSRLIKKV